MGRTLKLTVTQNLELSWLRSCIILLEHGCGDKSPISCPLPVLAQNPNGLPRPLSWFHWPSTPLAVEALFWGGRGVKAFSKSTSTKLRVLIWSWKETVSPSFEPKDYILTLFISYILIPYMLMFCIPITLPNTAPLLSSLPFLYAQSLHLDPLPYTIKTIVP